MNWILFAIFAVVALVLDRGLFELWHIQLGFMGSITPSCLLVLAVFVAMLGPGTAALWSCIILGLLVDLSQPLARPGTRETMTILGPAALGFLAGGFLVLQLRSLVYRCSPLSLAAIVFLAGLVMHLVAAALLTFRGLPYGPMPGFSLAGQLLVGFFDSLYSAALAIPLAWLLLKTMSWWRFESGPGASLARRLG